MTAKEQYDQEIAAANDKYNAECDAAEAKYHAAEAKYHADWVDALHHRNDAYHAAKHRHDEAEASEGRTP